MALQLTIDSCRVNQHKHHSSNATCSHVRGWEGNSLFAVPSSLAVGIPRCSVCQTLGDRLHCMVARSEPTVLCWTHCSPLLRVLFLPRPAFLTHHRKNRTSSPLHFALAHFIVVNVRTTCMMSLPTWRHLQNSSRTQLWPWNESTCLASEGWGTWGIPATLMLSYKFYCISNPCELTFRLTLI